MMLTDVSALMRRQGWRLVMLTPLWRTLRRDPAWQQPNVHYEPYEIYQPVRWMRDWRHLQNMLFGRCNRIKSLEILAKHIGTWNPPLYFLDKLVLHLMRPVGWPVLRFCERWNRRLVPQAAYSDVFRRYRPDVVVSTHPYLAAEEPLLAAAANRSIPLVAAVLNWDQVTTKGKLWVRPDRVLVWNAILKDFVLDYYPHFRDEDVVVTGIPQYDYYADPTVIEDRASFLRRLGADPDRPTVAFAGAAPRITPRGIELVEMLFDATRDGRIAGRPNFVFRPHPKEPRDPYDHLRSRPGFIFQPPGPLSHLADRWLPDRQSMVDFANLLKHSDVVINPLSTVCIDAAAFDTPSVCTVFDGYHPLPEHKSIRRFMPYTHLQTLFDTHGVRLAHDLQECIDQTNAYLADPTRDAPGRQAIRDQHCYRLDGRSAERFVAAIAELL